MTIEERMILFRLLLGVIFLLMGGYVIAYEREVQKAKLQRYIGPNDALGLLLLLISAFMVWSVFE